MMRRWRTWGRRIRQATGRGARALARAIITYERVLIFAIGVATLSAGAAWMYPPAGLLVAGGLLVWVSLPTRRFPIIFSNSVKERE